MRIDPLDFSQARIAPESVMRGLEEIDATACLVHLGGLQWLVGKVRPTMMARREAEGMLANWTRAVMGGKQLSAGGKQRVRLAQLGLLGVRPVQQYQIRGEPTGRIVRDFERSRFLWLRTSETDVFRQIDAAASDRRDAAIADVASLDRAKDAHHYAFTRTHTTSATLTPTDRPKPGWSRHGPSGVVLHT